MNKIRHFIRKTLSEAFGVVLPIDELADWSAEYTLENLKFHKKQGGITNKTGNINFTLEVPEHLFKQTLIKNLNIKINFNDGLEINKINSGEAHINKTKKFLNQDIYVYDGFFSFGINWDYETDILKEFTAVFSHELHHLYDYILRNEKKSKTNSFNDLKNLNKLSTNYLRKEYPEINDFMNHFYFIIPQEINARAQEAYNLIKHHKDKNNKDFIDELLKTSPIQDAKNMINYNIKELDKLPEDVLKKFIIEFNKDMRTALLINKFEGNEIVYPKNDVKAFFNFWKKRINKEGYNLFFKITKMAGATKNINEENSINKYEIRILAYANKEILEEILGFDFFSFKDNFGEDRFNRKDNFTDYLNED